MIFLFSLLGLLDPVGTMRAANAFRSFAAISDVLSDKKLLKYASRVWAEKAFDLDLLARAVFASVGLIFADNQ